MDNNESRERKHHIAPGQDHRIEEGTPVPQLMGVYETILYADDIAAATHFYRDVLRLPLVASRADLVAAFRLPSTSMLLVFNPSATAREGRPAPSHGAQGAGHVAFAVKSGELELWRRWLEAMHVAVELDRAPPSDGGQLYVRDPAGNSIEFVDGELWPMP